MHQKNHPSISQKKTQDDGKKFNKSEARTKKIGQNATINEGLASKFQG